MCSIFPFHLWIMIDTQFGHFMENTGSSISPLAKGPYNTIIMNSYCEPRETSHTAIKANAILLPVRL